MPSDADNRQENLNKLLGRRGSLAERLQIARELDDDSLMLAAAADISQAREELERRRHDRILAAGKRSKLVTFLNYEQLPITRDGLDFGIDFAVVDSDLRDAPEEKAATKDGRLVIGISRTLQSIWGLEPALMNKVLLEFAKRHIATKIQDGTLSEHEELQLTTANTPSPCPFDPNRISVEIGRPMEFPMEKKNPVQAANPLAVAARIVDARDNVNAIFHDKYGEDLLTLHQERALLELFRSCQTQEEFGYRVSALAGLAGAVNAKALAPLLEGKPEKLGQIQTLRKYLARACDDAAAGKVCDPLSHLNRLRQMYPIHTDDAKGIMEAHRFFGLDYPIRDWSDAWGTLLEAYAQALESLLRAIKKSTK
jgi:hypothetical protein